MIKRLSLIVLTLAAFSVSAAAIDCRAVFPGKKTHERHDNVNLPFENDPALLGRWESVDFVPTPQDFDPAAPRTVSRDLFLKEMVFLPNGKIAGSPETWTKGHVLHRGDRTDQAYEIKEIGGDTYLFLQWKSGDYLCLNMEPQYYVLKKTSGIREDNLNLAFKNDKKVLGQWQTVDFVFTPEDFTPGKKYWRGDLYLKTLTFLPKGKTPMSPAITWTKGYVLHHGDKTASAYTIKRIDGKEYMFFEWKSGDYIFRGQEPAYYVLQRAD